MINIINLVKNHKKKTLSLIMMMLFMLFLIDRFFSNVMEFKHFTGATLRLIHEDADDEYFAEYEYLETKKRAKISSDVMIKKDCIKFVEWQHKNIPGILPFIPCPWEKIGPIRRVEMNGETIYIPREYLSLDSKNGPNGPANIAMMGFIFPRENSDSFNGKFLPRHKDVIRVWMEDVTRHIGVFYDNKHDYLIKEYTSCSGIKCTQSFVYQGFDEKVQKDRYVETARVEFYVETEEEIQQKIDNTDDPKEKERIRVFHEKLKRKPFVEGASEVYIDGDPHNPTGFMLCGKGERNLEHFCASSFFHKGIFFRLRFRKYHLDHYDDMHKYFLNLINQWSNNHDK